MKIFISYSRQDDGLLGEFTKQLDAATNVDASLEYWYDKDRQEGIQAGEQWAARLKEEIHDCDAFCLFLTSNSAASPNCLSELDLAKSEGKPVVQIRVRSTSLPLPQASFLPNKDVWIAATSDQGVRDGLWHEVVTELQRIKPDEGRGKRSQFSEFDRLCEMFDRLKTFKHFHDVAHELYEEYYKDLAEEFKTGKLDPRTVGPCVAFIGSAIADLDGLSKDKDTAFIENDRTRIDDLKKSLDACKAPLDNLSRGSSAVDSSLEELKWKLPQLGSSLGLALSYFNQRMVDSASAKGFDAKRLAESLEDALAKHQEWKEEWSRLAASIDDARGRLLSEHDVLQNIQASLLKHEPEVLDNSRKRTRFVDEWLEEVAGRMKPLLDQWKERAEDPALDEPARQQRTKLATYFEFVDASVAEMNSADIGAEVLSSAKRSYGDFLDIFDKYFLKLDKILKKEYDRIDVELDQHAGRFRAQEAR